MPQIIHSKKSSMDKFMFGIGVIGPLMTIPQVSQIWVNKNTSGVSLLTWGTLTVLTLIWIMYGYIHKQKPLVFYYFLCFLVDIAIVVGLLIYR